MSTLIVNTSPVAIFPINFLQYTTKVTIFCILYCFNVISSTGRGSQTNLYKNRFMEEVCGKSEEGKDDEWCVEVEPNTNFRLLDSAPYISGQIVLHPFDHQTDDVACCGEDEEVKGIVTWNETFGQWALFVSFKGEWWITPHQLRLQRQLIINIRGQVLRGDDFYSCHRHQLGSFWKGNQGNKN